MQAILRSTGPCVPPRVAARTSQGFSCARYHAGHGAVRLAVSGELDIATVLEFDDALRRANADAALVIVDLRELEFIDSSGAHAILAADRRMRQSGGRLGVMRGPAGIDRFFKLIGIDGPLELVDQPPAAPAAPAIAESVPA